MYPAVIGRPKIFLSLGGSSDIIAKISGTALISIEGSGLKKKVLLSSSLSMEVAFMGGRRQRMNKDHGWGFNYKACIQAVQSLASLQLGKVAHK